MEQGYSRMRLQGTTQQAEYEDPRDGSAFELAIYQRSTRKDLRPHCTQFPKMIQTLPKKTLNTSLQWTQVGTDLHLSRVDRGVTFPGQPRLRFDDVHFHQYIQENITVPQLDRLAPYLWPFVTPRFSHIHALHHQTVRGRNVIITEDPNLHLVWYHDRIYIKPIPNYLLSTAFWEYLQHTNDSVTLGAARGFLRTYAYLIKYEIDFNKATSKELGLIPTCDGTNPITFERFIEFIELFGDLHDDHVCPRYTFGEIRLTRLNKLSRLFLGKLTFLHTQPNYNTYISSLLAPTLTLLAPISIVLSAMQVQLAAAESSQTSGGWLAFALGSKWFSVAITCTILLVLVCTAFIVTFMVLHDVWFAWNVVRGNRKKSKHPQSQLLRSSKLHSSVV